MRQPFVMEQLRRSLRQSSLLGLGPSLWKPQHHRIPSNMRKNEQSICFNRNLKQLNLLAGTHKQRAKTGCLMSGSEGRQTDWIIKGTRLPLFSSAWGIKQYGHVGPLSLKHYEAMNSWLNKASALWVVAIANWMLKLPFVAPAWLQENLTEWDMGLLSLNQCLTASGQRAGRYLPVWRTVSGSKDGKRRQSADLQRKHTYVSASRLSQKCIE